MIDNSDEIASFKTVKRQAMTAEGYAKSDELSKKVRCRAVCLLTHAFSVKRSCFAHLICGHVS